ncbi:MAG TPA: response regulator [Alloacidobacterium sp.]|nr:response regulator [Alloacidobacterium sp.]
MLDITSETYLFSRPKLLKRAVFEEQEDDKISRRLKKPTILVVDDQHLIADTTTMVLNRFGFLAERAYSGETALEMALRLKPDYLLTDIVMPGMNGVDLAISVRKRLPATIIVLLSGQAGVTNLLKDAKIKGHEFDLLAKPIHPEKLMEYLRHKAPHFWQ